MYCGGTVFVEHASGMIDIYNQVSLGTSDTLRSKEIYENKAKEFGITIKGYRGDNGVYKSKSFLDQVSNADQQLSLSRVGAHGKNVVA